MAVVVLPDGKKVRFPDDMPMEEIRALIEHKYPDAVKAMGAQKQPGPTVESAPEWRRGNLAPVERNEQTGELRWAVPGIVTGAIEGAMAPGKALQGGYDNVEIDPQTGAVAPFSSDMMDDASALAGVISPGAPKGAALGGAGNALTGAARDNLKRAMKFDGILPEEVPARLRALGPDAIPGDLGPALQAQTQAIAALPGSGQKQVFDTLTTRKAGRNARIIGGVDETLGPAPIPSRLAAENFSNREALSPEYTEVLKGGSAVDTQQIANNLDSEIVNRRGDAQTALKKIRTMLNVVGTEELDPNPRTLLETRKAIDGLLATEKDTNVIGALADARRAVDAELAAKVPGIKDVDAKFEELANQDEAVTAGQQTLDSGRTAPRPEELADTMTASAVPERGMGPSAVPFRLTQGNRAEIERIIGTTTNDLNALKTALKGDGSWNRDRLVTLYGQEKADALLGILDREVTYSATEGAGLGGSRTAVLNAANEEIVGRNKKPGFFQNALNLSGGSALAALGDNTLGWIDRDARSATGAAMADYLTAREGSNMLKALPNKSASTLTRAAPSLTLREIMERGGPKPGQATRIDM